MVGFIPLSIIFPRRLASCASLSVRSFVVCVSLKFMPSVFGLCLKRAAAEMEKFLGGLI